MNRQIAESLECMYYAFNNDSVGYWFSVLRKLYMFQKAIPPAAPPLLPLGIQLTINQVRDKLISIVNEAIDVATKNALEAISPSATLSVLENTGWICPICGCEVEELEKGDDRYLWYECDRECPGWRFYNRENN